MALVAVDIADFRVSADPEATLVTYALGSCIAVVLYDPLRKRGGMLHLMLPSSANSPERARTKPAMFADTGLPLLFEAMARLGSPPGACRVKLVGGARRYEARDNFDIGRRNHLAVRKLLWRLGLMVSAEEIGGTRSRTVRLEVGTGRVTVRSEGEEWEL